MRTATICVIFFLLSCTSKLYSQESCDPDKSKDAGHCVQEHEGVTIEGHPGTPDKPADKPSHDKPESDRDHGGGSDRLSRPDLNYHQQSNIQLPVIVPRRAGILQRFFSKFTLRGGWAFYNGSWHRLQAGGFYKDQTVGIGIGGKFGGGNNREGDYHGRQ